MICIESLTDVSEIKCPQSILRGFTGLITLKDWRGYNDYNRDFNFRDVVTIEAEETSIKPDSKPEVRKDNLTVYIHDLSFKVKNITEAGLTALSNMSNVPLIIEVQLVGGGSLELFKNSGAKVLLTNSFYGATPDYSAVKCIAFHREARETEPPIMVYPPTPLADYVVEFDVVETAQLFLRYNYVNTVGVTMTLTRKSDGAILKTSEPVGSGYINALVTVGIDETAVLTLSGLSDSEMESLRIDNEYGFDYLVTQEGDFENVTYYSPLVLSVTSVDDIIRFVENEGNDYKYRLSRSGGWSYVNGGVETIENLVNGQTYTVLLDLFNDLTIDVYQNTYGVLLDESHVGKYNILESDLLAGAYLVDFNTEELTDGSISLIHNISSGSVTFALYNMTQGGTLIEMVERVGSGSRGISFSNNPNDIIRALIKPSEGAVYSPFILTNNYGYRKTLISGGTPSVAVSYYEPLTIMFTPSVEEKIEIQKILNDPLDMIVDGGISWVDRTSDEIFDVALSPQGTERRVRFHAFNTAILIDLHGATYDIITEGSYAGLYSFGTIEDNLLSFDVDVDAGVEMNYQFSDTSGNWFNIDWGDGNDQNTLKWASHTYSTGGVKTIKLNPVTVGTAADIDKFHIANARVVGNAVDLSPFENMNNIYVNKEFEANGFLFHPNAVVTNFYVDYRLATFDFNDYVNLTTVNLPTLEPSTRPLTNIIAATTNNDINLIYFRSISASSVDLTACTKLFQAVGRCDISFTQSSNLTSITIPSTTQPFRTIDFEGCALNTFDFSKMPNFGNLDDGCSVDLRSNNLTTPQADQMVIDMDTYARDVNHLGTSFLISILTGNDPLSASGLAAKTSLESKGWVVV